MQRLIELGTKGSGRGGMRAEEGPMSPQMARLVHERLQAEVQALKVKFTLCFVAILFALAGAAFLWGGLKQKRKPKRSRSSRGSLYNEDLEQEPTEGQSRVAKHLLRNRVRREHTRANDSAWSLRGARVYTALTHRPAYVCSIRALHRQGRAHRTPWRRGRECRAADVFQAVGSSQAGACVMLAHPQAMIEATGWRGTTAAMVQRRRVPGGNPEVSAACMEWLRAAGTRPRGAISPSPPRTRNGSNGSGDVRFRTRTQMAILQQKRHQGL